MNNVKRYNEAEVLDKIKKSGWRTIEQAANAVNLPRTTVRNLLIEHGLYRRKSSAGKKKTIWTLEKRLELQRLRAVQDPPVPFEEMANILKVSVDAVKAAIRIYCKNED